GWLWFRFRRRRRLAIQTEPGAVREHACPARTVRQVPDREDNLSSIMEAERYQLFRNVGVVAGFQESRRDCHAGYPLALLRCEQGVDFLRGHVAISWGGTGWLSPKTPRKTAAPCS